MLDCFKTQMHRKSKGSALLFVVIALLCGASGVGAQDELPVPERIEMLPLNDWRHTCTACQSPPLWRIVVRCARPPRRSPRAARREMRRLFFFCRLFFRWLFLFVSFVVCLSFFCCWPFSPCAPFAMTTRTGNVAAAPSANR